MIKTSQHASADAFTAIAHPIRRKLLDSLATGDSCVQDLAKPFRMTRPAISQHLRVLKDAGLVTVYRSGREQRYVLCSDPLEDVYNWVEHYQQFWTEKLDALGKYLEENE